jgi:LPS export ABC transporter protein LptC
MSVRVWTSVVLIAMMGCAQRTAPPVTMGQDVRGLPDQESWNSRVVFSDSGMVKAILVAAHAAVYDGRHETVLDSGVTVDFYNADGSHTSRLRARRGRVDDLTKDLEAFEQVVFQSDSGTVVKTEYLRWDNATKRIRSDRFVTVDAPKEYLEGYGFEADQSLKNYVIYRVSGRAEMRDEK